MADGVAKNETSDSASSITNFKCVLCSDQFCSREDLQTHFRGHATDRSLKKKCQNAVSSEVDGAIHCDVCGAEFTNNTLAIQHKFRKHPQAAEKHICPTCGKAFTIKALLDRHLPSHVQDRPRDKSENPCSTCGAQFDNTSALEYHEKTTHMRVMKLYQPIETAPPSKKIKINNAGDMQSVYFCHICGSEYIVKFNLQKHLESFHTEDERFAMPTDLIRCTACDALFYNRKAYDNHNIGHKPTDLYVTNEQQRLKMVSRVDQDFDVRRVLPLAEKYVPSYRRKRKTTFPDQTTSKKNVPVEEEEQLSPPSSPDPSDSDPCENDSDTPLTQCVSAK